MPANFNNATAFSNFPELNITNEEAQAKSSPTVGDPGFIVEQADGTWQWVANLHDGYIAAGTIGAIYQSWEVCDYFKQFAEEAHIDPKTGVESFTGPVQ